MTKRIAYIYCRTNGVNYESLQAQDETCNAWAEANGYKVEGLLYDEVSAMSEDKPCFGAALILLADNTEESPALIVPSIDRLARELTQFVAMREAIKEAGGRLIVVDQQTSDTPMGALMQNLAASKRQLKADANV